jgi:hypothetical protein
MQASGRGGPDAGTGRGGPDAGTGHDGRTPVLDTTARTPVLDDIRLGGVGMSSMQRVVSPATVSTGTGGVAVGGVGSDHGSSGQQAR